MSKGKRIIFIIICIIIVITTIFFLMMKNVNKNDNLEQTNSSDNSEVEEDKKINLEYFVESSWEQDGKTAYKYNVKLINNSEENINDWKIVFDINTSLEKSENWNCDLEINDDKMEVKPLDYNKIVEKNNNQELGFILFDSQKDSIKGYKLYINGVEYMGDNSENYNEDIKEIDLNNIQEAEEINSEEESPVYKYGRLSVKGKNIVDKDGNNFLIQGVSTHGIEWYSQYINIDTFRTLRDEFNVNTIRIAIYSDVNAGYKTELHEKVSEGVKYAKELGMYVIIDWHILNDNDPNQNKEAAINFFKEMAIKYKNYDNVLYEICNEPNGEVYWKKDIKPYAEELIEEIRKIDDKSIIIVGTPTWCQDVDIVSQNPIENKENIIYALHFYAESHKETLRNKLKKALDSSLPILVSEFGISDASGNGQLNKEEGNKWIQLLRENNIGYVCWNLSNKDETSSLLKATTTSLSNWTDEELSEQGLWIKNKYNN